MAPNVTSGSALLYAETETCPISVANTSRARSAQTPIQETEPFKETSGSLKEQDYKWNIRWRNVIAFVYLHVAALHGLYLLLTGQVMVYTTLWGLFVASCTGVGITAGAHRLWAHRSYKAKWPLRLLLMVFQTTAFQNSIYEWVRDHRVHHKFTDTDADPHNASRGFFFSHMGWLMIRKHPDVRRKGAGVDMSDLEKDSIVMWQKSMYAYLMILLAFVIPAWIPIHFWGEEVWTSIHVAAFLRYVLTLHATWLVNSAAHIWGTRPIDRTISPTENLTVAYLAFGEGWHNYHHVFPWDYKAAELGDYNGNLTTGFIDFFSRIGWAYDLKTVSADMVRKRVRRTGDGTHRYAEGQKGNGHHHHHHYFTGEEVWGWGDKDMCEDDIMDATIINRSE